MIKKTAKVLSQNRRLSVTSLVVAMFAAASFGFYFKFFSEAAPVATSFEAEAMSVPPTILPFYFWYQSVSDSAASPAPNGRAKKIYANYAASKTISTTQAVSSIVVHARGERLSFCSPAAPNMQIIVDGSLKRTVSAVASTWADYSAVVNLPIGTHTVKLGMTNDSSTCNRNLLLDKVTLVAAPVGAPVQAKSADGFIDSIGVGVRPANWYGTVYEDRIYVKNKLLEAGFRNIRINLGLNNIAGNGKPINDDLKNLAAVGIKSNILLGNPWGLGGTGTAEQQVYALKNYVLSATASVEGANEWDCHGGSTWVTDLRNYQQRIYNLMKADPALRNIPVIGTSFCRDSSKDEAGNMESMLDWGSIHPYPGALPTEPNIFRELSRARNQSGSKPVAATEEGYYTAVNTGPNPHPPTSERAMSLYVPQMFVANYRAGVRRTFEYELIDTWPDSTLTQSEKHFGLIRNNRTDKPAFKTLKNTTSILKDPGPAFTVGGLSYTLTGDTGNIKSLLMQKRDGSFYLAVWSNDLVWDRSARRDLFPAPRSVQLNLAQTASQIVTYKPTSSSLPQSTVSNVQAKSLSVTPDLTIYKISP